MPHSMKVKKIFLKQKNAFLPSTENPQIRVIENSNLRVMDRVFLFRYYEFEVITTGHMKVGWAQDTCKPGMEIGLDGKSYAFDGFSVSVLFNF